MSAASELRLPNPPGAIRRWLAAHPRAIDTFILVCYLIGAVPLALLDVVTVFFDSSQPNHLAIAAANACVVALRLAAGTVALLFRRKAPLAGLIIIVVALIGDGGPIVIANSVASWFLLYAIPVYRDVRSGWIGYGIAVGSSLLSTFVQPLFPTVSAFGDGLTPTRGMVILDALWLLAVLLIGINLGNRRRYLAAIIDRAHQLARERDQLAMLAVSEERERLAREIHDIVAHSVSVMIALSEGAARAVTTAPDEAANAMQRSAETGRAALAEMRRLLGALQADEVAELAPQPSVSDIPALVAGFTDAGLTVELSDAGVDLGDRMQGLAIYRVVQEGLTNVLRYAGKGARADVTLRPGRDGIEIIVRDYGRAPGSTGPTTGLGSGRGLAGLAERVRVFGGRIESGPAAAGLGWELRAYLPNGPQAVRSREEGS